MMRYFILFALCFGLTAYSHTQEPEQSQVQNQELYRVPTGEVDAGRTAQAEAFARDFFTALKHDSTYAFSGEAIEQLASQLTPENQRRLYTQLKDNLGDFNSVRYAETWVQKGTQEVRIYRMKSQFENSDQVWEIRVVLNKDGQIAGFWIAPWADELN